MVQLIITIVLAELASRAVEELIGWCRAKLKRRTQVIEVTGVLIEDFESPDVRVRRRAFQILARNFHKLHGYVSPELAAALRHLEERQPQQ